ncbi:hypothetical protein niasHT_026013 [Heterodera trifolii]|uniref:Uncharacterized protein n=1 Tax=Heterodera trifolii TaxID=157864 RepID=A0ABD2JIP5_9BILA
MCQFGMAQQSRTEESAFTLHLLQWHSLKRGMPETQHHSATCLKPNLRASECPGARELSQPHPNTACHDGKIRTRQKKAAAAEHEQFNRKRSDTTFSQPSTSCHTEETTIQTEEQPCNTNDESNDDTDSKARNSTDDSSKVINWQLSNTRTSNKDEPTAPSKDEPTAPSKDEPTAPSKDEPTTPSKDEPTTPSKDEPTTPSKDEPTTPSKDEPTAPSKDESTASQPRPR